MPKSRKRKPGGGATGHDDTKAKKAVRAIMVAHPKWKYYAAALSYARTLPPSETKPESIARRIADKLKREDGVFQRRGHNEIGTGRTVPILRNQTIGPSRISTGEVYLLDGPRRNTSKEVRRAAPQRSPSPRPPSRAVPLAARLALSVLAATPDNLA